VLENLLLVVGIGTWWRVEKDDTEYQANERPATRPIKVSIAAAANVTIVDSP